MTNTIAFDKPSLENITSVIFPKTPSKLNIHFTPKNAEFLGYTTEGNTLSISAWMPHGFAKFNQVINESDDQFYENYCEGCERNCYEFLEQFKDEDGYFIDTEHLGDHCYVYDNGYSGQHCPKGYSKQRSGVEFSIANMVFEIELSMMRENAFSPLFDSAYLCAGEVDLINDIEVIYCTEIRMAANVFGDEDYPEGICWGHSSHPNTLNGIVSGYTTTKFNNDLVNIPTFKDNCREIPSLRRNIESNMRFLCYGVDGLLLLHVEKDIQAFFTFITAGFKSLPHAPHIMIIPVNRGDYVMDGVTYSGYTTYPDAVGRNWFITMDGYLLGQV